MSWSPTPNSSSLLTGAYDNVIHLWDINANSLQKGSISPKATFRGHSDMIGDVSWHATHPNLFGSVSDDKYLYM